MEKHAVGNVVNDEIDFFKLFGLKKSFVLSLEELDRCYFKLQIKTHPDRNKDEDKTSADLNIAYRILKNPVSRAEYLLTLMGYSVPESEDVSELFEIQEKVSGLVVEKEIKDKISDIHHYINTNTNPDKDSRFVQANPRNCLFCLYNEICDLKNM